MAGLQGTAAGFMPHASPLYEALGDLAAQARPRNAGARLTHQRLEVGQAAGFDTFPLSVGHNGGSATSERQQGATE